MEDSDPLFSTQFEGREVGLLLARIIEYILQVHDRRGGKEIVQRLLAATKDEEVKEAMESAWDFLMNESRLEGKRETLLLLLGERFGELPSALVTRVQAANVDALDRWTRRLLSAPTLEEVLTEG